MAAAHEISGGAGGAGESREEGGLKAKSPWLRWLNGVELRL